MQWLGDMTKKQIFKRDRRLCKPCCALGGVARYWGLHEEHPKRSKGSGVARRHYYLDLDKYWRLRSNDIGCEVLVWQN